MPYNPNIPQPTDKLQDSQPQILANFQALNTSNSVDHVTYGNVNEGKHKFVHFRDIVGGGTTNASEVGLYARTSAKTGILELFYQRENLAPLSASEYEITALKITTVNTSGGATGWTRLPSGLLIKFGIGSVNRGAQATITFPVIANTPVFTAVHCITVTPYGPVNALVDPNIYVTLLSGFGVAPWTTFKVWGSNRVDTAGGVGVINFNYVAMGEGA